MSQNLPSFISTTDNTFKHELELGVAVHGHVSIAPVVAKVSGSCPQSSGDLVVLSELHVQRADRFAVKMVPEAEAIALVACDWVSGTYESSLVARGLSGRSLEEIILC